MHGYALSKCYLNSKFCVINRLDKILLKMLAMTAAYVKRDFHPSVSLGSTRWLFNTIDKSAGTALVELISWSGS